MRFCYFFAMCVANMLTTSIKCPMLALIASKVRQIFAIFNLTHARWTYVIAYVRVHHSQHLSLWFQIVILVCNNLHKTFLYHYTITAIFRIEIIIRFYIFKNLTNFLQLNLRYFISITYLSPICVDICRKILLLKIELYFIDVGHFSHWKVEKVKL